jgi:hypothetical protein
LIFNSDRVGRFDKTEENPDLREELFCGLCRRFPFSPEAECFMIQELRKGRLHPMSEILLRDNRSGTET